MEEEIGVLPILRIALSLRRVAVPHQRHKRSFTPAASKAAPNSLLKIQFPLIISLLGKQE